MHRAATFLLRRLRAHSSIAPTAVTLNLLVLVAPRQTVQVVSPARLRRGISNQLELRLNGDLNSSRELTAIGSILSAVASLIRSGLHAYAERF